MIASPASALLGFDTAAFGRALIEAGDIGEQDWRLAQEVARRQGVSPVRGLLELGLIGEEPLADRLARATGAPRWKADDESLPVADSVPQRFMLASSVLVLEPDEADAPLRLVCVDPADHHSLRSLVAMLDRPAEVAVGVQKEIEAYLEAATEAPEAEEADAGALDVTAELSHLRDMASEAPVIRFFNQAVERALDLGASDIHIERFDRRTSLRMRVDGMLVEQPAPPLSLYEALICRVKIMAGLDIAERRLAQDGRIRMRLRGRSVDLRVSLVPTMYGQDAAIRLQDRQRLGAVDLPALGYDDRQIRWLDHIAHKSHGILLITGPTGSGKTTTLYALLRRLVGAERKILTVEDPVEYAMEGVNQIQVNSAVGMTFGRTLRHVLRHDPDVILIGEIRDHETAEIAFQAALTGHMVLSTLHTNDVPGTFVRLIDMGVEPYLVNAAVEGVSAQRLLRRVCADCRNQAPARDACAACKGIGYRGRVAVMEHSGVTPDIKRAVLEGADERRLRETLEASGYTDLRARAMTLVARGVTDEAEVARALGSAADEDPDEGAP
ncbi:MAG: GspE/PulE family protein [Phycisphaerales bacterium]